MESFAHVSAAADLVLVEGAGSAAEMNLREGDIANMGFACAARMPVVLVADIDRGGVLASIVGTYELLPADERALLAGYIVNKFRGDVRLFDGAIDIVAARTGLASLGVVPWFQLADRLPAEDAMSMHGSSRSAGKATDNTGDAAPIRVAVPRFSRIANFDDLDPLIAEADVHVSFIAAGEPLPGDADLIVLPGSKSTIAELDFLRSQGWDIDLAAHVRRGGWVIGLCAGFQMLGNAVRDPGGIEGAVDERRGLALLDVETCIGERKQLRECHAVDALSGQSIVGYEMHMGVTGGSGLRHGMLSIDGAPHGAVSTDGRVMGCYVHGLFAADGFREAFLNRLRTRAVSGVAYEQGIEDTLDALAEHLQQCLDLDRLLLCARQGVSALTPSPEQSLTAALSARHLQ
jgi:adenosylcobyric acid synthase